MGWGWLTKKSPEVPKLYPVARRCMCGLQGTMLVEYSGSGLALE